MSNFSYFMNRAEENNTQNTSSRVPSRPQGWKMTLKHNAQDGSTSLSINLRNDQNVDRDYCNVNVNSFEFVVAMVYSTAVGNAQNMGFSRISSNVSGKGIFAPTGNSQTGNRTSLGLFTSRELREAKLWPQTRVYGILRAVNDANPASVPEVAQYCGTGAIPVVMDLTFDKVNELAKVMNISRYDIEKQLIGKSIKITHDDGQGQNPVVSTASHYGRKYIMPHYTVTSLTDDEQNKMDAYAGNLMQQLIDYDKRIEAQDELFLKIHDAGVKGPSAAQLLDAMNDASVSTIADLETFVASQGGWTRFAGQATPQATPSVTPSVVPSAAPQPQVAPQATTPQANTMPQMGNAMPQGAPQATQPLASQPQLGGNAAEEQLQGDGLPF